MLAVWSGADWLVFYEVSIDFLQYKNGSKIFYDLLRPIPTYTEGPQIFKKIVIALLWGVRQGEDGSSWGWWPGGRKPPIVKGLDLGGSQLFERPIAFSTCQHLPKRSCALMATSHQSIALWWPLPPNIVGNQMNFYFLVYQPAVANWETVAVPAQHYSLPLFVFVCHFLQ